MPAGDAAAPHLVKQPSGEEESALLEEELRPAIQHCLARIDELDGEFQAQQDAEPARLEAHLYAQIELPLA